MHNDMTSIIFEILIVLTLLFCGYGLGYYKGKLEGSITEMAKYLARQIKMGKLDYDEVIAKYPQFKEEIDRILGM